MADRTLRELIPGFCEVVEILDGEGEGYTQVLMFASEVSPSAFEAWFRKACGVTAGSPAAGTFELYLPDGAPKGARQSVIFVDCQVSSAVDRLCGCAGSKRLRALGTEGYRTLGLGFDHVAQGGS